MDTLGRWTFSIVLAMLWIAFAVWQWRWRGWDAFAAEHRGWGVVARVAVILVTALLILRTVP